jgi:membrane associated rhomboid family serine protease
MKLSAVKILVAANVLVFVLQSVWNDTLLDSFALWPLQSIGAQSHFRIWQVLSYAFLHGSVMHVAFNMLGLWMFGSEIERYVGPRRLSACYFASVLSAALSQLFIPMIFHAPPAPTIGASGGVFGLLLAYACLFPTRKVVPLIPPIPMPAWLFATFYAGIELYLGVTGSMSGVAHFAHLGGMVGSALVILQWRHALRGTR